MAWKDRQVVVPLDVIHGGADKRRQEPSGDWQIRVILILRRLEVPVLPVLVFRGFLPVP